MEPWIQPTTAPQQPDLETEEPLQPRVERGWMEAPRPADGTGSDSLGIKVLVASVAIGFPLLMVVLLPLMLRWLAS